MDSIRFEPSVSATFAPDRQAPGGGSDLFADMLGDHLKKRADADRHDNGVRRRPNGDRRIDGEDHPAPKPRARVVIKNAHELRDVAKDARDVTPPAEPQGRLPAPADETTVCMDGQADDTVAATAEDKDQRTDQREPAVVATQTATETTAEETPVVAPMVAASDGQALVAPEIAEDAATIAPAEPAGDTEAPAQSADPQAQPDAAAAQAGFAADVAASLGDAVLDLTTGQDADMAASAQTLAAASPATLVAPQAAAADLAEAPQAAAIDLAAKITPEAPRPVADAKPRSAPRATPNAEIKPTAAGNPAHHTSAPIQPAAQTPAAVPALGESTAGGFDTGLTGEGPATPGWAFHLAQGAASRRPDFIAQLRQHLQELPAHEQVAVNIQRAMRAGVNRMTIDLSPAELGKIHVKLEIDEEKRVSAAVTVEKPSTLELLQRDAKALERALQDAGLKMEGSDLSFSLARQNGDGFGEDMGGSGSAGIGDGAGEAEADPGISAPAAALVDTAAGLVNVQI